MGDGRGFVNEHPLSQVPDPLTTAHLYGLRTKNTRTAFSPRVPTAARDVRVKVTNRGRRGFGSWTGYVADVEVKRGNEFHATEYADFMRLTWSDNPGSRSLDLLPDVPHWLDVVSTLENVDRFFLETDPKTTRYADCFDDLALYRLTVMVFAEEAEPARALVHRVLSASVHEHFLRGGYGGLSKQ